MAASDLDAGRAYGARGPWAPGVRLFGRLNFLGKATLVSAALVLVLAQLSFHFLSTASRQLDTAARELRGLTLARELLPLYARAQALRSQLLQGGGSVAPAALAPGRRSWARRRPGRWRWPRPPKSTGFPRGCAAGR